MTRAWACACDGVTRRRFSRALQWLVCSGRRSNVSSAQQNDVYRLTAAMARLRTLSWHRGDVTDRLRLVHTDRPRNYSGRVHGRYWIMSPGCIVARCPGRYMRSTARDRSLCIRRTRQLPLFTLANFYDCYSSPDIDAALQTTGLVTDYIGPVNSFDRNLSPAHYRPNDTREFGRAELLGLNMRDNAALSDSSLADTLSMASCAWQNRAQRRI